MNDEDRRSMPLFSISIVMKLTELSARQIRNYEDHELIKPERSKGNRRLFSFRDVDRLLEIKSLLDKGINLTGIKHLLAYSKDNKQKTTDLSERELRHILKHELIHAGKMGKSSLRQGQMSQFFQ